LRECDGKQRLKSSCSADKEKKEKEMTERLIIFLSGLLITLVFIALGLNYYSKLEKAISEPDIKVVTSLEKPATPPQQIQAQPQPTQPLQQPTAESQPPQPKQEEQPAEQLNVKPEEAKKPVQEKELSKEQLTKEQPKEEKSKPSEKQPEKPKSEEKQQTVEKQTEKPKQQEKATSKEQSKEEKPKQPAIATKVEKNKEESEPVKHEPKENKKVDSKEITSIILSDGFSIQAGAFSTREKAETEKAKYSNVYIVEESGLYKVLVGKFKTEKEARDYQREHNIKGFIKRVGS
jgi:cell division protein FtsN